jgi:Mitochondrial carrier protein
MSAAAAGGASASDRARPFLRGTLAGMIGWMPVHPADLLTKRMQTQAAARDQSMVAAARAIVRTEGPSALYSGLSAALARQAVYTTLRLGLYESLRDASAKDGKPLPVAQKLGTCRGERWVFVVVDGDSLSVGVRD